MSFGPPRDSGGWVQCPAEGCERIFWQRKCGAPQTCSIECGRKRARKKLDGLDVDQMRKVNTFLSQPETEEPDKVEAAYWRIFGKR